MRKFLTYLLALVLSAAVIPAAAFADSAASSPETLRVSITCAQPSNDGIIRLSARPSTTVGNSTFNYTWQRSTDDGQTWTDYCTGCQTLCLNASDGRYAGNLFRVTLMTDIVNDETGEYRTAKSEPVRILAAPCLVLDYVPPLAGDIAEFVSHFELNDDGYIDVSSTQYVWEQSTDSGTTWSVIEGETGSSLRIPTSSSIDPNAPLVYIRVRAIVPDHDSLESNWRQLTVRIAGGGDEVNANDKANGVDEADENDSDQSISINSGNTTALLANPLKMSAKQKNLKASTLRNKACKVKAIFVKRPKGRVTFKLKKAVKGKKSVKRYFKVNSKTGKITVKRGTRRGLYMLKIKVKASGNRKYLAKSKTVTVKIRVR